MLEICETFVSLSGEASWQGLVSTFVRFAGCDVDCQWCDTGYAKNGESTPVELEQVVSICRANGVPRVILTGGEPLMQDELPALCSALLDEGFEVQVETSGTRLVDKLDKRVSKIVDIKPPGAGAKKGFHWRHFIIWRRWDKVKTINRRIDGS